MHTSDNSTDDSFYTPRSLRRKNNWLITLRWMATGATLFLILGAYYLLPGQLPWKSLFITVALLGLINGGYAWYGWKNPPAALRREWLLIRIQILLDLVLLTILLHFSGGIENPLYLFYIFHIIIACTIFEHRWEPIRVTASVLILFSGLILAEDFGWIHHHTLFGDPASSAFIFASLGAFYVMTVASTYLGITLMDRHRKVKALITKKNQELEETAKSKMTFFRYISHELKSPIVAVQSYINVVLDLPQNPLTDQSRNILTQARNRTTQMLDIIKDLLELSYDRRSEPTHSKKQCAPNACLREILKNELPKAEAKKIDVETSIPDTEPNFAIRRFLLEKIITNLISNAIRYTGPGGHIHIRAEQDDARWRLKIQDDGIGISEEDQERIFEEFYRGKNARDSEAIGTGLGLSIVKKFVDQLQGCIELDSAPGRGTTIIVTLPRTTDEN
ncbi:MAG: HAMP domain-containing histidine kinase [FCB group bacterium]|nr:HAMP domain-containing histidine kinase [FCB group bacterium]